MIQGASKKFLIFFFVVLSASLIAVLFVFFYVRKAKLNVSEVSSENLKLIQDNQFPLSSLDKASEIYSLRCASEEIGFQEFNLSKDVIVNAYSICSFFNSNGDRSQILLVLALSNPNNQTTFFIDKSQNHNAKYERLAFENAYKDWKKNMLVSFSFSNSEKGMRNSQNFAFLNEIISNSYSNINFSLFLEKGELQSFPKHDTLPIIIPLDVKRIE